MAKSHLAQVMAGIGLARRVVIVGGPRRGKTTLAAELAAALAVPHRPTDALKERGMDWSKETDEVAGWLREPGDFVVEGVAAVRALRRLIQKGERPAAVVVRMRAPVSELSEGQARLSKGVDTIWAEVAPELRRQGVAVLEI